MMRYFVIILLCIFTFITSETKANTLPPPYSSVWQSGVLNDAHSGANLPFPQCTGNEDLTISSSQNLVAGLYSYDELTVSNGANLSFSSNAPVFIHVNKLIVQQASINHNNAQSEINPLVIIANEVDIQGSNIDALIYVRKARTGLHSNEYDIQGSNIYGAVTAPESLKQHGNVIHNYRFSSTQIGRTIAQNCPTNDPITATYFDKFDLVSYQNSDGLKLWQKPWVELGENDGVNTGHIAIENGRLKLSGRRFNVTRKLDLSAYNSATVSFDYEIDTQRTNEKVTFDVGTKNNRWKRIIRFDRLNPSGTFTYVIDPVYIHSNSRFRLRTNGAFDFGNIDPNNRDFFYVDNFAVNATSIAATYLDLFTVSRYDNNHGEKPWSSNWQESEGGNSPTRGHTKIRQGKLEITNRTRNIERKFDLSRYATAEVEFVFDYQTSSENSDVTILLSKDNRVTWQSIYQFNGETNGSGQRQETISINQFTGEQEVWGRIQTSDQFVRNDMFELDYIAIRGFGVRNPVDHYRIIHPAQGLTCQNHQIQLQACGNTDCSIKTTDDFTATVIKQFGSNTEDILTVDTATNASSTSGTFNHRSTETIRFALSDPSIQAQNSTKCYVGGTEVATCEMTVSNSGFVVTAPNFVSASGWQSVSVQALATAANDPTTCVSAYDNVQPVEIDFNHISAIRVGGDLPLSFSLSSDGSGATSISNASSLSVNLDFGTTNSRADFFVNYADVGELQLIISDDGGTRGLTAGTANFVAYPSSLSLSVTNAAGNGIGSVGSETHFADQPFNFKIEANNALGQVVLNYTPGNLQLKPEVITAVPVNVNFKYSSSGIINIDADTSDWPSVQTNLASSFGTSGYSYSAATFDNVGEFNINVRDSNYYGLTILNSTNNNDPMPAGRYTPAYFSIVSLMTNSNVQLQNTHGNSSYIGESIDFVEQPRFQFIANTYTNNPATNYAFNMSQFDFDEVLYTDNAALKDESDYPVINLPAALTINDVSTTDGLIEFSLNGGFSYNKTATVFQPIAMDIGLIFSQSSMLDDDNVGFYSSTIAQNDPAFVPVYESFNDFSSLTGSEMRYGRLFLENSSGTENQNLLVPAYLQYWDGNAWLVNTQDSTTNFSSLTGEVTNLDFTPSTYTFVVDQTDSTGATVTSFSNGIIPLGAGFVVNNQNTRTQLFFRLTNVPSHLNIDWDRNSSIENDGDPGGVTEDSDDDPLAQLIFGSFSGNKRIIYKRER